LDIERDNSTTPGRKDTVHHFLLILKATLITLYAGSFMTNMFDDLMDIAPTPPSDDELQWYLAAEVEDVKDGLM